MAKSWFFLVGKCYEQLQPIIIWTAWEREREGGRERERERERGREGGREGERERVCVYMLVHV